MKKFRQMNGLSGVKDSFHNCCCSENGGCSSPRQTDLEILLAVAVVLEALKLNKKRSHSVKRQSKKKSVRVRLLIIPEF